MRKVSVVVAIASVVAVMAPITARGATGSTFDCPTNPKPTARSSLPLRARALGNGDPLIGQGDLWTTQLNPVGYALDGTWATKQPWFRAATGKLTITGRRLDGRGHFTADVPPASSYARTGFLPSGLRFSSAGCWEVTARLRRSRVVLHVSIDGSKAAICRQLSMSLRTLALENFPPNDRLEAQERAEYDRRHCSGSRNTAGA